MNVDKNDIDITLKNIKAHLLTARNGDGHWRGRLASSALATATAIGALTTVDRKKHQPLIRRGLDWLAANANFDGGFGDTTRDISNVPATVLAWAAFGMAQDTHRYEAAASDAESWIKRHLGTVDPENIVRQITAIYGTDRTFSA
ncbi:MAG: squalene--hopene cyclase, partial [Planctomycetes bacterium]|nr:squalene--hopene cyclase [Planctomycetota bacterium]